MLTDECPTPRVASSYRAFLEECEALAEDLDAIRTRTVLSESMARQARRLAKVFANWTQHPPSQEDRELAEQTWFELNRQARAYMSGNVPRIDRR